MLKVKNSFLIYSVSLIFLTIFRLGQLKLDIDPATGFTNGIFSNAVLYGVLAVLLVVFLVCCLTKKFEEQKENFTLNLSITKYLVLIYSVTVFVFSLLDLKDIKYILAVAKGNPNILLSSIFLIVTSALGIFAGLICFVQVVYSVAQKSEYKFPFASGVFVVAHSLILFLNFFINERTLVTISQNLLTLFFWACALNFFFSYSKFLNSSKIGKPFSESVVFGYLTSILGAVIVIPPLFVSTEIYYSLMENEYLFAIPVFLIATAVSFSTLKKD